ncbi:VWA domain-containing protein [Planctomycetota bacterium]
MIHLGRNLVLNFSRVWAAYAALSLAVIAILFLIQRRWRKVKVPSHLIWRLIMPREEIRGLWRRCCQVLNLMLWLLMAAAAVIAAMGPSFEEEYQPGNIVFVLDNSLSMSLRPQTGDTRMELALGSIRSHINSAHDSAEFMLLTTAPVPEVCFPWQEKQQAENQLITDNLPVTSFGGGNINLSMRLAARYAGQKENSRIVLMTDGSEPVVNGDAATLVILNRHEINIGIDDLEISQDPFYLTYSGAAHVHNYGLLLHSCTLKVALGDYTVLAKELTLAPGAIGEVLFDLPLGRQGILTASLGSTGGEEVDLFGHDNVARAYVPRRELPRVILVEPEAGASLLAPALFSLDALFQLDKSIKTSPAGFEKIGAQLRPGDLVIFDNCAPLKPLPEGNYLLVNSATGMLPFDGGPVEEAPGMGTANSEHPLVRFLALEQVHAQRIKRIQLQDGMVPFLLAGNSPVLFEFELKGRRMIYLAFDLAESNFILLDSFPMFIAGTLRYFSRQYQTIFQDSYKTGAALEPRGRFSSEVTILRYEDDKLRESWTVTPDDNQQISFTSTQHPGQYYLQVDGKTYTPACVNFFMPGESIIDTTLTGRELISPQIPIRPWLVGRPAGQWLVYLALGLLAVEWLLYVTRIFD